MGLPKTGTTYLQGLLADNREALARGSVLYPFLRLGGMFHAAVEVRGSQAKFGLDPDLIDGSWLALCERARAHHGVTIISHEILGGATPTEIAAALEPLAGLRVEVIVTARDLARQATAHWQEEIKLGDTASFADFERDQFRADIAVDSDPGGARPHFWHAQDYSAALGRWAAAVGAGRTHLVICPPAGAPADELWRRFCAAVGMDVEIVDVGQPHLSQTNASLGRVEIAVLRAVNAELGGDITQPAYSRVVKAQLAERVLTRHSGERPRTPAGLVDLFARRAADWRAQIEAEAYHVHGGPSGMDDLTPLAPLSDSPHPDEATPEQKSSLATQTLAELMLAAAAQLPPQGPAPPDGESSGRQVKGRGGPTLRRSRWRRGGVR